MMNSVDVWVRDAAQNPYLIVFGLALAVMSAWQPIAKIVGATRNFLKDVIAGGIRSAIQKAFRAVEIKVTDIAYSEDKAVKILVMDLSWSLRLGLMTIFLFLMSLSFVIDDVEQAVKVGRPSNIIAKLYRILAGISALVWFVDALFQTTVHTRAARLLREKDPLD